MTSIKENDVSGITFRLTRYKLLQVELLFTKPSPVKDVGQVTHCRILDRFLRSEEISSLLLQEGFQVLTADELDRCIGTNPTEEQRGSYNALGSHWMEAGVEVVRRYANHIDEGFKPAHGLWKEKWGQGYWFSCKLVS